MMPTIVLWKRSFVRHQTSCVEGFNNPVLNSLIAFVPLGPCKSVRCSWKPWTDWSATCGLAERTRSIQATQIVVQQPDCSGLPQTCTQAPQKETKKTMCTCQTVQCAWSQWSDWSATCGQASRTRKIKYVSDFDRHLII